MCGLCGCSISDMLVVMKLLLVSFGWCVVVFGGSVWFEMWEKFILVCLNIVFLCSIWVWLLLLVLCVYVFLMKCVLLLVCLMVLQMWFCSLCRKDLAWLVCWFIGDWLWKSVVKFSKQFCVDVVVCWCGVLVLVGGGGDQFEVVVDVVGQEFYLIYVVVVDQVGVVVFDFVFEVGVVDVVDLYFFYVVIYVDFGDLFVVIEVGVDVVVLLFGYGLVVVDQCCFYCFVYLYGIEV